MADNYDAMRDQARERNRRLSAAGRDIAPLPEVVDPVRRTRARVSFRSFCGVYFPHVFTLPWSEDHEEVISHIEHAVLRGGLFALAMPRGSGKTSLCERAAIWALLCGHRRFVVLIGPDEGHAVQMLDTIKTELGTNDLLLEDFPEVCYPVRRLEGIANRCTGQLFNGKRTQIVWQSKELVLPTLAGSTAGGAILRVAGLTGQVRGMKYLTAGGESVRPDLVIPDDPQTDESARSLSQCQTRLSILEGAVLGLAGPSKKIAGVMPLTVIRPGDLADRILDRDKYPEWQGERTRMVDAFPEREDLWTRYAEIRTDSLVAGGDGSEATVFYAENREAMDAGAKVAWPERHDENELSGLQHAMNLKLRNEDTFWAEYQNEPNAAEEGAIEILDADAIAGKINRRPRGEVPLACDEVTAFVDVGQGMLFWCVVAWRSDFTGYVLDYGTEPEQRSGYFATTDSSLQVLLSAYPGTGIEGAIYSGLEVLVNRLLTREWKREDGAAMHIGLCLIDQGWKTDVVHQFCRQSQYAASLMPSRGHGVTASQKPFGEYDRRRGDRVGHYWWIPRAAGRAIRHVEVDTNYWKTFIQERLATAMADKGSLSIFGGKPHQLFGEHLASEYKIETAGQGRVVDVWKMPPTRPDNHWLDCLVGCAAAASVRGVAFGAVTGAPSRRRRVKISEKIAERNGLARSR